VAESTDLLHFVDFIAGDFNTTLELHLLVVVQQFLSVSLSHGRHLALIQLVNIEVWLEGFEQESYQGNLDRRKESRHSL